MARPEILKDFPILNSRIGPKTIPAINVYLHANQAERNHRQSVNRLAERCGLSWCELFAVLHDKPWRSMNEQEAHDGVMSLLASPEHQAQVVAFARRLIPEADRTAEEKSWLSAGKNIKMEDAETIRMTPPAPAGPRHRFVWLNLADGTFSESWQEGEHPPESSLHEEKLAAEANERDTLFKLIKYVCMNDGSFSFDHHMKLR